LDVNIFFIRVSTYFIKIYEWGINMSTFKAVTASNSLKSNFGKYGWFMIVYFGITLYLNSSFTADGMNVIVPTMAQKNGWDPNLMLSFNGIAGWVSIAGAFLLTALVTRFGAKPVVLVSVAVTMLSVLALAFGTGMTTWIIAIILINSFCNGMSFVGFGALIASWFPVKKGLAMGWATMGNNLASAIFIPIFMFLLSVGNAQTPFIFWAAFMFVLLIIGAVFIKNTPEEVGLAPDNEPLAIEQIKKQMEEYKNHVSEWTIGRLLKDKEIWLMGCGYGLLFMATVGMVMQFVPRVVSLGFEQNAAVAMLSVAAVIGIVASYLWGVIDQKFSTKTASKILALWFAAAFLFNMLPGRFTLYISVFFLGCALGGNTNFSTSMTTTIFGKYDFSRAWSVVFPITCFFRAAAAVVLGVALSLSNNNFVVPYIIFMIGSLIAFVLFSFINDTCKGRVDAPAPKR